MIFLLKTMISQTIFYLRYEKRLVILRDKDHYRQFVVVRMVCRCGNYKFNYENHLRKKLSAMTLLHKHSFIVVQAFILLPMGIFAWRHWSGTALKPNLNCCSLIAQRKFNALTANAGSSACALDLDHATAQGQSSSQSAAVGAKGCQWAVVVIHNRPKSQEGTVANDKM